MHLIAALGSVTVDRVSKNFGAAMTEFDKLMRLQDPEFRIRVRYARAEVLMDQENYAEALGRNRSTSSGRSRNTPDALILRGKIQFEMRKLVEASEIELGPSQDNTVIVPGETVKINLRDPTLSVSGVGADIEVEIWAKSGDRERVLLYQLGDSKEKFRAEVPTALGPPTPGDKVLQILGDDEIRFGYSERFRAKMNDLPAGSGCGHRRGFGRAPLVFRRCLSSARGRAPPQHRGTRAIHRPGRARHPRRAPGKSGLPPRHRSRPQHHAGYR